MHGELERTTLALVEASRNTTSDTSAAARALRDDLLIQGTEETAGAWATVKARLDPWGRQA